MNTTTIAQRIRTRFDHEQNRLLLKEKYKAKMVFTYSGGMWRADPELLVLIKSCPKETEIVLEDLYGNPVKVNTTELYRQVFDRWQEQMNAWLLEFEQARTQR